MQSLQQRLWSLVIIGGLFMLLGGVGAQAAPDPSGSRGAQLTKRELDIAEALLRRRLSVLPQDTPIAVLRDAMQVTLRMPASALFDPDSTELKPDSLQALPMSAVTELLRRRYRLVGQVNVYTDRIGGEIANHGLTELRALALLTALHTTRIRPTRVAGAGLGAEAEVGSDDTPEGREQNRRIELVFGLALNRLAQGHR